MYLFGILAGLISQLFVFKYLILKKVRLENQHLTQLYKYIKNSDYTFLVENSIVKDDKIPDIINGLYWVKSFVPIWITRDERENKAGWSPVTSITNVFILRWNYKKFIEFFENYNEEESTTVDVTINDFYLGKLVKNESIEISSEFEIIEKEFQRIDNGEIDTTSCLFYGDPGNGKTTLIRNLATKYGWNIHYFDIENETKNTNIISLLSKVNDRTIVLLEDFDSVFNKREQIKFKDNKDVKFSYDAILNLLDGVYKEKKKIIFIMTANDIEKIDDAIRYRRSRMRYLIEVGKPNYDTIVKIIGDPKISRKLFNSNCSLDNVYDVKYKAEHKNNKQLEFNFNI